MLWCLYRNVDAEVPEGCTNFFLMKNASEVSSLKEKISEYEESSEISSLKEKKEDIRNL